MPSSVDSGEDQIKRLSYGPVSLVVIQATPFCNLDCDYCYLPDRGNRNQMDPELLDPILDAVLSSPYARNDFTLLWHAGEPLTMPRDFYDNASSAIARAGRRYSDYPLQIAQSIQTNATLIDQRWCDCLRRNAINVGVSLDGPAFLHDAHRRTRKGLGSHAATMRGIENLQKNDIPFSVISVLTETSLDHPDELFQFFIDNGINDVGFNMEETEGMNRRSSLDHGGCEERYRQFLERIWELTQEGSQEFRLREFDAIFSLAYTDSRLLQTDMNQPFVIVSFDHRGNFSTFDPELLSVRTEAYGDFSLGNVFNDTLESVTHTDKFQQIERDMRAGVLACRQECSYFGVCGGGAGSNKYWERGTFACTETQACRYRIKMVADVALSGLEKTLGLSNTL
ncbi:cyclophane-forming radical SAM/SPASM peptide maturase GrrM/OscB [Synechococcus sp. BSA11S]|uniref:cyclophane-forming radical SAM/SPASM peptide maturase GrrM/OscB n=1 Tax=Synechococcales TaxID=1890424 RepID=UPI00351BEFA3